MPRYFALHEAEATLAGIRQSLQQAVKLKAFLDDAEGDLLASTQRITFLGGAMVDRQKVLQQRARRDALSARLKETLDAIHETGCLVKDLDLGLVDFPCLFRDTEVYLCWKLGEDAITFWHGVEEGFRGRKRIDREFLENHRGDAGG